LRESASTRGRRLLTEGRLIVKGLSPDIEAACRGDSGAIHRLGYRDGRWWCECEARTRCAHLVALMLVVAVA
jgi:hypothetical protein